MTLPVYAVAYLQKTRRVHVMPSTYIRWLYPDDTHGIWLIYADMLTTACLHAEREGVVQRIPSISGEICWIEKGEPS